MDFPAGGSISAPDGATITFGPEGGALALGEGGSITLGEGGSIGYLEGGPADMSQGGTVQLGPGGSITFGNGGSLATGAQGGISTQGAFGVVSARTVLIASPRSVRLGDLRSHGVIEVVTQDGDVLYEEATSPFTFTMPAEDTGSRFSVEAVDDVVWGKLLGAPNVSLTAMNADMVSVWVEATLPSGESIDPALSCGGASAGTFYLTSSGTPPADSSACFTTVSLTGEPLLVPATIESGGGSMGWFGLLVGLAALGRRRR